MTQWGWAGQADQERADRLAQDKEYKLFVMVKPDQIEELAPIYCIPAPRVEECLGSGPSKFESYEGYDFMTALIPSIAGQGKGLHRVCIYFRPQLLMIVSPPLPVLKLIAEQLESGIIPPDNLERILYCLFDRLTDPESETLEKLEQEISLLEETLIISGKTDYIRKIVSLRNRLMTLKRYYVQLLRLAQGMEENENELIAAKQSRYFRMLTHRMERLCDNVNNLRDYVSQVREAYQSQVDINLNKIMKIFTVVTAVFSPLTLIVGWYGMNLKMPEFGWSLGYPMVALLCVLVSGGTLYFFKRRKWF
jgi:magnesium transporter